MAEINLVGRLLIELAKQAYRAEIRNSSNELFLSLYGRVELLIPTQYQEEGKRRALIPPVILEKGPIFYWYDP